MSEQQPETVTVPGHGRKLRVLSEYATRQAVCGYSVYGQRVLDAAARGDRRATGRAARQQQVLV